MREYGQQRGLVRQSATPGLPEHHALHAAENGSERHAERQQQDRRRPGLLAHGGDENQELAREHAERRHAENRQRAEDERHRDGEPLDGRHDGRGPADLVEAIQGEVAAVAGDDMLSLRRNDVPLPGFPSGPQVLFTNGDRLAGTVRDRFGRLAKNTILAYIDKCLHSAQQIDRKTYGGTSHNR